MASSECANCGHAWDAHPGARVLFTVCGMCVHEGIREQTDMCSRTPPGMEHVPVGDALVARVERRPLRGDRVVIEHRAGGQWALMRPGAQLENLVVQIQEDLAKLTFSEFLEKYDALFD